jgi:hypothetical protein
VRVLGYPKAVHDVKVCYHTMGISCGGDEVRLLEFLILL